MNSRRHAVALSLALISVGVLAGLLCGRRAGSKVSFAGAYPIGTNVDWSLPQYQRTAWISTNELLFFWHQEFSRLNLETGEVKPLVTSLELEERRELNSLNWSAVVSPDGRYICLDIPLDNNRRPEFLIRLLDGHTVRLPDARSSRPAWLLDSSGWVACRRNSANGRMIERFDLSGRVVDQRDLPSSAGWFAFNVTEDGRLFPFHNETNSGRWTLESYQLNLADLKLRPEPFRLRSPDGAKEAFIMVSPLGDRMVVEEFFKPFVPKITWKREYPFVSAERIQAQRLWGFSLDGRNAQLLWDAREMPAFSSHELGFGTPFWWFPDGRAICFWAGSNLWVRPFTLPKDTDGRPR